MHNALLAVMRSDLNTTAKSLAAYCYAHTNGTGYAEMPVTSVTVAVGCGEHKLRSYRAELARIGYMASSVRAGVLIVDVNLDYAAESAPPRRATDAERAPTARFDDDDAAESAPPRRATDADRAPTARFDDKDDAESAPPRRATDADRAPTARFDDDDAAESAPPRRAADEKRAVGARSLPRAEREKTQNRPPHTPLQGIVKNTGGGGGKPSTSTRGSAEGAGRAAELLVAAGVEATAAAELASRHGLRAIACHVAVWQTVRLKTPLGVGALIHRITKWSLPPATQDELRAGLLAEHITADDLAAWGIRPPHTIRSGYDVPPEFADIIKH